MITTLVTTEPCTTLIGFNLDLLWRTQVAEVFTGTPGKYVTLEKTLSGFGGILTGKYDDLPEMAFYMVSTQHGRQLKTAKIEPYV